MPRTTYHGPDGIKLVIDTSDIDTPSMVYLGRSSATFDCAVGEGEIESTDLNRAQLDWLESFQDESDAAYSTARAGLPEYGN